MDQLQNRQGKFAAYFSQKNDYAFFVGVQTSGSFEWTQVYQLDGTELVGLDFQRYPLENSNSWLVVYPRTGEIVDGEQIFDPLPEGVTGNLHKSLIDIPAFTFANLERGRKLVEIEFSPSPTHPKDARYYSTRLTNRSDKKVKCLMFAAYTSAKGRFVLCTVTGRPFNASQFAEWYAVDTHGWLLPGGIVCDPTNYGSRCYWVYYF